MTEHERLTILNSVHERKERSEAGSRQSATFLIKYLETVSPNGGLALYTMAEYSDQADAVMENVGSETARSPPPPRA